MTNKKNIYAHSLLHTCSTSAILLMLACCMACSGSDSMEPTPTEKQTAISFSGTLPEENTVTRAATGLEEVLTGDKTFQVWGYKNDAYDDATTSYTSYQAVMPNFTVNWGANTAYTTTSNTDDWEYVGQGDTPDEQTIKYWDFDAKAYRFFGVTNWGGEVTPADANKIYGSYAAYGTYGANSAYEFQATVDASTDASFSGVMSSTNKRRGFSSSYSVSSLAIWSTSACSALPLANCSTMAVCLRSSALRYIRLVSTAAAFIWL